MTVLDFPDHHTLSTAASDLIIERLGNADTLKLGVSTGFSPGLTYSLLKNRFDEHPELATNLDLFQLDEWSGLSAEDEGSCQRYVREFVVGPWQLKSNQYFLIDGTRPNESIVSMRDNLQKPLDLCILGLGKNGHLALNEPGSTLSDPCRIVDLADTSKRHEMIRLSEGKITQGITIGLKEILETTEVILLVAGEGKQEGYQQLMDNAPIEKFPASALHLHDNWHCLVDQSSVK